MPLEKSLRAQLLTLIGGSLLVILLIAFASFSFLSDDISGINNYSRVRSKRRA